MKKEKKNGWGGARKGAGRPRTDSRRYGFMAGGEIAAMIDAQENKSEFIKSCMEQGIKVMTEQENRKTQGEEPSLMVEPVGEDEALPQIDIYDTEMPVVCGVPLGLGDVTSVELTNLSSMLVPEDHPARACRVKGDSMIEAHMFEGDIVLVDVSPRVPSENDVALCELNGEYTFKYIRRHDDKVWLVPANPDYKEIEITCYDEFHVRGIAKSVVHIL